MFHHAPASGTAPLTLVPGSFLQCVASPPQGDASCLQQSFAAHWLGEVHVQADGSAAHRKRAAPLLYVVVPIGGAVEHVVPGSHYANCAIQKEAS